MSGRFVDDHWTVWPIIVQGDVLQISHGGLSAWRNSTISGRARRRTELTARIREIQAVQEQGVDDALRVHRKLIAQVWQYHREAVAEDMKRAGIGAKGVQKSASAPRTRKIVIRWPRTERIATSPPLLNDGNSPVRE